MGMNNEYGSPRNSIGGGVYRLIARISCSQVTNYDVLHHARSAWPVAQAVQAPRASGWRLRSWMEETGCLVAAIEQVALRPRPGNEATRAKPASEAAPN
jgi:hypothetical protein